MKRLPNAVILLFTGTICGAVLTYALLSGSFYTLVSGAFVPDSIDDGWGSILASFLAAILAFSTMYVQRHLDRKDAKKDRIERIYFVLKKVEEKMSGGHNTDTKQMFYKYHTPFNTGKATAVEMKNFISTEQTIVPIIQNNIRNSIEYLSLIKDDYLIPNNISTSINDLQLHIKQIQYSLDICHNAICQHKMDYIKRLDLGIKIYNATHMSLFEISRFKSDLKKTLKLIESAR